MDKARGLFLCTHNSARSQMAEGFLRAKAGNRFEVASAGTEATRVHPFAVRAMDEVGVDLRAHTSKTSFVTCATRSWLASMSGPRERPWGVRKLSRGSDGGDPDTSAPGRHRIFTRP